MNDNKGCPGCKSTSKTQSNSSGGGKGKRFGNRAKYKAFAIQEQRKLDEAETSVPRIMKNGGSVLGFDYNNLRTSNFKNKNK